MQLLKVDILLFMRIHLRKFLKNKLTLKKLNKFVFIMMKMHQLNQRNYQRKVMMKVDLTFTHLIEYLC
jgi:hypothetical protein